MKLACLALIIGLCSWTIVWPANAQMVENQVISESIYEATLSAPKNKARFMPFMGILSSDAKIGDSERFSYSGTSLGFTYLLGLSESFSLGTRVSWRQTRVSFFNSEGLEDVAVLGRFKKTLNPLQTLYYGVNTYLSFDERQIEDNTRNNFSGGQSVEPYMTLAFDNVKGRMLLGVSYLFNGTKRYEQKTDLDEIDFRVKGGDRLEVKGGYETFLKQHTLGLSAGIYTLEDVETSIGFKYEGGEFMRLGAYYIGSLGVDSKIIPSLDHVSPLSSSDQEVKGFIARLTFSQIY